MPRSQFSNYRNGIRLNLIKLHKWKPEKATVWIRNNREYIKNMYETDISSVQVASRINSLEGKLADG